MFVLFFPPPATGWHVNSAFDLETDEPTRRHKGKWVHVAARAVSEWRSNRCQQRPPAPGKEIGGSFWARLGGRAGRGCGSLRRFAIRLSRSGTSLLLRVRLPASPLTLQLWVTCTVHDYKRLGTFWRRGGVIGTRLREKAQIPREGIIRQELASIEGPSNAGPETVRLMPVRFRLASLTHQKVGG
jgi:hypothetical protein